MSPFANCLPLQAGRPFTLSSTVGRLAVFCLLLASLSKVCSAQNTKGLPEVGNGSAASSSQMFVDATAFSGAADMCASIAGGPAFRVLCEGWGFLAGVGRRNGRIDSELFPLSRGPLRFDLYHSILARNIVPEAAPGPVLRRCH
jgi:hypothetical protein